MMISTYQINTQHIIISLHQTLSESTTVWLTCRFVIPNMSMFHSTWWIIFRGWVQPATWPSSGGSIWCSTSRTFVGKTCCGTWSPIRPSKRASWTSSGVPGNSACCCLLPPWRFGFKDLQPFMFRCVQRCFNNEEIPKTGKVVLLTHLFRSHDLKTFRDHFSEDLYHNYMCTSLSLLYSNILELHGKSQVPSFHCKISHNPSTDMPYGFLWGIVLFQVQFPLGVYGFALKWSQPQDCHFRRWSIDGYDEHW